MQTDIVDAHRPPALTVRLLGPVEILVHGVPLPRLRSRKGIWLICLLTLRKGKPVERDCIAGTLWPDSSQSQSLAYLRHCLTELRHALGSEAVRLQSPTSQTLLLDIADTEIDVVIFDSCIQQGDSSALRLAASIYRGPLLGDCSEEWVLLDRGNREQSYFSTLQQLASDGLAQGDFGTAIEYARRAIAADPLQEGAQRTLIEALASSGDFGAAVQAYRELRLYLHQELNTAPSPQTTNLYNRIRAETRQAAIVSRPVIASEGRQTTPHRIPRPLTDLLGREEEVSKVAARLVQRRLLTLTGTGGLGKTRLAVAVSEILVDEFADGVWFVELAGISDPNLVIQSVASALGIREEAGRTLHDSLISFLRTRYLLLVLDNCEHLLEACATLAIEILDGCSGVKILATSRQALGITGEVNWPVPMLPVPDLGHLPTDTDALLAVLNQVPSVRLFVERAESLQKDFALTPRNAISISRICQRLDGIPLAIELAAGNVKVLPIDQIYRRLDDVLRLLTRGSRTAEPRQQTLQATLDWSYDLLTDEERGLLKRLSVFADGWTLDAAELVCATTDEDDIAASLPVIYREKLLDVLTSLIDKSLVQVAQRDDSIRYLMLETVRQYARVRLEESGENEVLRIRHRDFFLELSEAVDLNLRREELGEWLLRLEEDHENLLAALEYSIVEIGAETGLRFCRALSRYWIARGHLFEGREWCMRLLSKVAGHDRATVLDVIADLASHQGDYFSARNYSEESLAIYRELGIRSGIASSLNRLGIVACNQDDYPTAQVNFAEGLAIYQEIHDQSGIAPSLLGLGKTANFRGEYERAKTFFEESLSIYKGVGDQSGVAGCWNGLGNVYYYLGDQTRAKQNYGFGLKIYQVIADRGGTAYSLNGLGIVALAQGDHTAARSCYEQSLAIYKEIGDRRGIACLLHDLGSVAELRKEHSAAMANYQESLTISQEIGDRRGVANSLGRLGRLYFAEGDLSEAREILRDSLIIQQEIGSVAGITDSLESFGNLLLLKGAIAESTILLAACKGLGTGNGPSVSPEDRNAFDRAIADVRQRLGEDEFDIAWARGSTMTLDNAVAMALDVSEF